MSNQSWDDYVNKRGPIWGREEGPEEPPRCFWCKKHCHGNCLRVNHENGPRQMTTDDPAYWMLADGHTSTPVVHREGCYICEDPEFAQMGLPLCRKCPNCYKVTGKDGHIPADDTVCDVCGHDEMESMAEEQETG